VDAKLVAERAKLSAVLLRALREAEGRAQRRF
jgi:hypothetical protein